jgi:hypothetical protein
MSDEKEIHTTIERVVTTPSPTATDLQMLRSISDKTILFGQMLHPLIDCAYMALLQSKLNACKKEY